MLRVWLRFDTHCFRSLDSRDIYYAKYFGKGGGGMASRGKNEKGERKKKENYIKKEEKALKLKKNNLKREGGG